MSNRQDKKLRKAFRKRTEEYAKLYGERLGNRFKPKPRGVPWFVWLWIVRRVFIIDETRIPAGASYTSKPRP